MCFSQNTHNGKLFSSFDAYSTLQGHSASGTSSGMGQHGTSCPETVFPRNETPKEPVRRAYKYPDADNKNILETLYFRESVNKSPLGLSKSEQQQQACECGND